MDRYELVDFLRDYIQDKLDNGKSNIIEEQVVIIVSIGQMLEIIKRLIWEMLKEMLKDVDNDCLKASVIHDTLEVVNLKPKNIFKMNIAIGRPDDFFLTGRRPKTVLVYGTNFTAEQMGKTFEFICMHEREDYCVRFFNR